MENRTRQTTPVPVHASPPRSPSRPSTNAVVDIAASFTFVFSISSTRLNYLLYLTPFVFLPYYTMAPTTSAQSLIFILSLLNLVPFAERLSFVTEHLCHHVSPTAGGLINATFGNASEVIFTLIALRANLYRVVQLSLLGSIICNLLFVLGCSLTVGGLRFTTQHFTIQPLLAPLLLISSACLVLPAVMKLSGQEDDATDEIHFSLVISLVMLVIYGGYIWHTLRDDSQQEEDAALVKEGERAASEGDDDDSEAQNLLSKPPPSSTPIMSFIACVLQLLLITIAVSLLSDVMVGTIDDFTAKNAVNPVFVAAVIIPIFGNGCEHMAAVLFAYKNRLDICLSIAIGSSIQITMLLLPFLVVVSYATGRELTLFMEGYEAACMMVACSVVASVVAGGKSNWMLGVGLIGLFVILSAGFAIHRREEVGEIALKRQWVDWWKIAEEQKQDEIEHLNAKY